MAQNVRRRTAAADHGILQIEIDRQLRSVSLQQTQHVLCLVACLVVRCRVGVQIHAIRDAEPLTGGNICTPLAVILRGQVAAISTADDRKIDLLRSSIPVDSPLVMADVDSFGHDLRIQQLRRLLLRLSGCRIRHLRRHRWHHQPEQQNQSKEKRDPILFHPCILSFRQQNAAGIGCITKTKPNTANRKK